MDDEYYDRDGHDYGQYLAETEQEAYKESALANIVDIIESSESSDVWEYVDRLRHPLLKHGITINWTFE